MRSVPVLIVSRDARERTSAAIRGERRRHRGRLRAHRNGAGHHLLCHPHHQFRPGADDDGDGDGHGGSSRRRLSDMGGGAPRPRLRLCPRGSFLSYRRSAYPGAEPLQFWLACQHPGLRGDPRECSRLYLGADLAGLSANVPGHELSPLGRGGDRSAVARDRDCRGPDRGFELVRRGTLFGKIGMATAADPEMATAVGVNTTVVAIIAFAASAFYAGVAGLLIGPTTFANPYLGDTFGTFGFIAMMIGGGTEKPIAAMFGGLLLGVCAEGANAMINSQASDWFPFIILVVVLIVSPRGLFSAGNLFRLRARSVASAQA